MQNVVSEKGLVKAIKAATKGRLMWQLKDNVHYLTNGAWAVKLEYMPTKVLSTLIEVMGKMPAEGQSFNLQFKSLSESGPDIVKLFSKFEDSLNTIGKLTTLMNLDEKNDMTVRFVKNDDNQLIAFDVNLLQILNTDSIEGIRCGNPNSIMIVNEQVIISPVMSKNGSWNDKIHNMIGA